MNRELLHKHINTYGNIHKKHININYYLEYSGDEYLIGSLKIENCVEVIPENQKKSTSSIETELLFILLSYQKKCKNPEIYKLIDEIIG